MKRKRPRISGGIGLIGAQEPETQESQLAAPSGTQWHSPTGKTKSGSQESPGSLQSGTQSPIKEENSRGSIAESGLSLVF